ncbi:MAG: DUF2815 family protein [Oscillospiraceae bacterium]|nr:DUF2815 family protein [Oscillospiraceae bacterium]
MYQNDTQKVLTGEVRLSYAALVQPRAPQSGVGEPKYSVTILIPKTDTATKAAIDAAMRAAAQEAVSTKWGGVAPPQPKHPLHDGDGVRPSGEAFGEECKGHWVITASSKNKPGVVNEYGVELLPTDIYSGMYGRVTIRFFGYSNSGNKGIGCGLGNVLKTRDGEPLSAGNTSPDVDFAGIINPAFAAPANPPAPQNPWAM